MFTLSLDSYNYFPTLRTRIAEIRALQNLDDNRKSKIVPLLTLGRWPKALDFDRSAEKAEEAMSGRPHFLDLTDDPSHLGDQQQILRSPENNFEAWRNFIAKFESAIPVVQIVHSARAREVTRQAILFERDLGRLAFRIRDFSQDTPKVVAALSALDDTSNAIVFIDCQYIRDTLAAYTTAAIAIINQLRTEFPNLMISVLSTSFPSSVGPFQDETRQRGSISIMERLLHSRIGGNMVAAYGDHGSVHSVVYDESPIMRWSPRIDYPFEDTWEFERRPGMPPETGYISAAQAISSIDDEMGSRDIWGEQMIIDAAEGNLFGKAPSSWISVRVNIHLSRQIDLSERMATADLFDEEHEEDSEDLEDD